MTTPQPLAGEAVAVRYKDRRGRWRYLNVPFTKGWTFPESLGTLEPLYLAPPSSLLQQAVEALEGCRDALAQVTTSETFYRDPRGDVAGPTLDEADATLTALRAAMEGQTK